MNFDYSIDCSIDCSIIWFLAAVWCVAAVSAIVSVTSAFGAKIVLCVFGYVYLGNRGDFGHSDDGFGTSGFSFVVRRNYLLGDSLACGETIARDSFRDSFSFSCISAVYWSILDFATNLDFS